MNPRLYARIGRTRPRSDPTLAHARLLHLSYLSRSAHSSAARAAPVADAPLFGALVPVHAAPAPAQNAAARLPHCSLPARVLQWAAGRCSALRAQAAQWRGRLAAKRGALQ